MLHVKLIEPPCTERYARWCERSKIPHQEEFSPTRFPDELSGSCGVTSDQLDPEWYVDMQIGKQWKMGPFSDC